MKQIMTLMSLLVMSGCFLFLISNEEYIPLAAQIGLSVLLVAYEFFLLKMIWRN